MTQVTEARKGNITREMCEVARSEGVSKEFVRDAIAAGSIVIPVNNKGRKVRVCGIGSGLRTKVNANIGTSKSASTLKEELEKAVVAEESGADTLMDLSVGGNLTRIRKAILDKSSLPLGTVPIYEAAVEAVKEKKGIVNMNADDMLRVLEEHARAGVDFVTIHAGVTLETLKRLKNETRVAGVVSRGGAFLVTWMLHNNSENPFYAYYDRVLEIAERYDVTLSLGDGMRPGAIADATDRIQIQELLILGELADRARERGIQVMIEGPGHMPINQIESNVVLEKQICKNAPFYVLGPLVTDVAPGYDHIVAAIGGALAAAAGADFLCYVTQNEHLGLPAASEVKDGVIAARIAAHAADIAKGIKGAGDWDLRISESRRKRNWKEYINLSIDPEMARSRWKKSGGEPSNNFCTMCGEYCSMKLMDNLK
jgi:phosphomethylpyrimidine synthase